MFHSSCSTRRHFLKQSLLAGAALAAMPKFPSWSQVQEKSSRVALMHGDDRTDNIFQALKVFEQEIKTQIGDRRIIIKPNNVSTSVQLCATHADALRGTLEFLKSIGAKNVAIAESAASSSTFDGYENYGYLKLADEYKVSLLDLDKRAPCG